MTLKLKTDHKIIESGQAIYVWHMVYLHNSAFYELRSGNVYVANGSRCIVSGASPEEWQRLTHDVFTEKGWESPWEEQP